MIDEKDLQQFSEKSQQIQKEIEKDIVGQSEVIEHTMIAMIAGGNVLLEGVPGVGKTRLVRSIGRAFDLPFTRIQFTPDLMPADVTGTDVIEYDENGGSHIAFKKGPVFSSIVLADEINRATPKTQSALLEAMQEHTVTASGKTYRLEEPFFVLATENPIEQDGTYSLPEAQTDRFMLKVVVPFPTVGEIVDIVNMTQISMEEKAEPVINAEELLRMRETAKEILAMDEILSYVGKLITLTHPELKDAPDYTKKYIRFGASPRAAQALITAGKVRALMNGRYNLSYDDIRALAYPVLRHRIKLSYAAITEKKTVEEIIKEMIALADGKNHSVTDESPADFAQEFDGDKKKKRFGLRK